MEENIFDIQENIQDIEEAVFGIEAEFRSACENGNIDKIISFSKNPDFVNSITFFDGIQLSCMNGHKDTINFAIESKFSLNECMISYCWYVCSVLYDPENYKIIEKLKNAGANSFNECIRVAGLFRNLRMIKYFLSSSGIDFFSFLPKHEEEKRNTFYNSLDIYSRRNKCYEIEKLNLIDDIKLMLIYY
jgi:hypothetical protein